MEKEGNPCLSSVDRLQAFQVKKKKVHFRNSVRPFAFLERPWSRGGPPECHWEGLSLEVLVQAAPSSTKTWEAPLQQEDLCYCPGRAPAGAGASQLPRGTQPGSGSVPPAPRSWPDPPRMEARCPLPNAALRMSSPVRPHRDIPRDFLLRIFLSPSPNYA